MGFLEKHSTGIDLYKKLQTILNCKMNDIRVVIGKQEVYPNEEMIRMDEQDICVINIRARLLGGMK